MGLPVDLGGAALHPGVEPLPHPLLGRLGHLGIESAGFLLQEDSKHAMKPFSIHMKIPTLNLLGFSSETMMP